MELTHTLKPVIDELDVTRDKAHCGGLFVHIVNPFEQAAILEVNKSSNVYGCQSDMLSFVAVGLSV